MNLLHLVKLQLLTGASTLLVPSAAIGGTAAGGLTEAEIVAGGKKIVITLSNDTWVAAGATFDAQRQNIIDGLDSAQFEPNGWNAEVRDKEAVSAVVRTSDTIVTITLSAAADYDITSNETITVTVPDTALASGIPLIGAPTFDVTADAPVATATSFGGGPFWRKYGYDSAYDEIREQEDEEEEIVAEVREKLTPNRLRKADDAVNSAAGAMLRDEPVDVVRKYERTYQEILKAQNGIRRELKQELESRKVFRAEVAKKLRMEQEAARLQAAEQELKARLVAEEDDIVTALLYFMN